MYPRIVDPHSAVEHMDAGRLRAMLADGADPNEQDPGGMPLLHHAIDVERDAAAQSGEDLTSALTQALLEAGADPHRRWLGQSALEFATALNHHLAVDLIRDRLAG
jgi:ankyrin repeat protein